MKSSYNTARDIFVSSCNIPPNGRRDLLLRILRRATLSSPKRQNVCQLAGQSNLWPLGDRFFPFSASAAGLFAISYSMISSFLRGPSGSVLALLVSDDIQFLHWIVCTAQTFERAAAPLRRRSAHLRILPVQDSIDGIPFLSYSLPHVSVAWRFLMIFRIDFKSQVALSR